MHDGREPQCSPDGQWVAYTVSTIDVKEDKSSTHVWMVSFDGKRDRQVTSSMESESGARRNPDGNYLSFPSSPPGKATGSPRWPPAPNGAGACQPTDVKGAPPRHCSHP